MDRVTTGLLLSPVIAIFFMDDLQDLTVTRAACNPVCWFHYVDSIFVVWPHGPEKLNDFLTHLKIIHPIIHFTMETESDGHLPFLYIDI
jgi:hypothetical protein